MSKRDAPTAIGGSCLMTIFAVICLVVFALLSVSTVQADGRLGEAQADAVVGYYAADCRAQEILAELRSGTVPDNVVCEGNIYRYECAVSQTQILKVTVKIDGTDYKILEWRTESSAQWDEHDSLNVWGAE